MSAPCTTCWYARMREDICGTYCTGGFLVRDEKCKHYINDDTVRERDAGQIARILLEYAKWGDENAFTCPVGMPDDLRAAADILSGQRGKRGAP